MKEADTLRLTVSQNEILLGTRVVGFLTSLTATDAYDVAALIEDTEAQELREEMRGLVAEHRKEIDISDDEVHELKEALKKAEWAFEAERYLKEGEILRLQAKLAALGFMSL